MNGTVKFFNNARGYGFIKCNDSDKEIFVHYSDIQKNGFKTLKEKDIVSFEIAKTEKGEKAVNVKKT